MKMKTEDFGFLVIKLLVPIIIIIILILGVMYTYSIDKDCLETFARDYCEAHEENFYHLYIGFFYGMDVTFWCEVSPRALTRNKYKFLDAEVEACKR